MLLFIKKQTSKNKPKQKEPLAKKHKERQNEFNFR